MSAADPERTSLKLQEELERLWEPYKRIQTSLDRLLVGGQIERAFIFLRSEFHKVKPVPRVLYQGPAGRAAWQKGLVLGEQTLFLNSGVKKTGFISFNPENQAFYMYAKSTDTTTEKGGREFTVRDMLATHAQIFENPNRFLEQTQRRKLMGLTLRAIFDVQDSGLKALYSAPRRGPDLSRHS